MKITRIQPVPTGRRAPSMALRHQRWRAALLLGGCLMLVGLGFTLGQGWVYARWVQDLREQTLVLLAHEERLQGVSAEPLLAEPAEQSDEDEDPREYDGDADASVVPGPLIEA